MSHVDEGTLHAWLDGGLQAMSAAGALPAGMTPADVELHLRACADCRALLEAERAVRERAGLVLRDAAAESIDVPPFEAVAAAAGMRSRRSWLPLAWAASVLLALGAGWWASDGRRAAEPGDLARTEAAAPVPAATPTEASTSVADAGPSEAPDEPAREGTGVAARTGRGAAATRDTARPAGRAADPGDATVAAARRTDTAARSEALMEQAIVAAAPPAAPRAAPPPAGSVTRGAVVTVPPPAGAPLRAIEQTTHLGFAVAQLQGRPALDTPVTPAGNLPLGVPVTGGAPQMAVLAMFRESVRRARAGEPAWVPLSSDDLRRATTTPLMVAGAERPTIEGTLDAAPLRLMRVRQRLDSGIELELLLWRQPHVTVGKAAAPGTPPSILQRRAPESAAAASAPFAVQPIGSTALTDGEHEVVVFVPALETYVALRAAVDMAELRALAARLVEVQQAAGPR
jgi:hypothetical protein